MLSTVILGASYDYHAQHMLSACRKSGINATLFDTALFPAQHRISWNPLKQQGSLNIDDEAMGFEQIKSVFWSSVSQPRLKPSQHATEFIASHDCNSMLRTFFQQDSIRWCNSWAAYEGHKAKPRQLSLAHKIGANIPPTYVGNEPELIREFANSGTKLLYKPVYGGALSDIVSEQQLTTEHLNHATKLAPVTLQHFIEGTNIRSFVIGEQVFSAEIKSDQIDFRKQGKTAHIAIQTPSDIQLLSKQIMASLHMRWTAIDWRRTPQGKYYFLEANPSPMFVYFERMTGYRITDNLVELLAK